MTEKTALLNSFDEATRRQALKDLCNDMSLQQLHPKPVVNMHMHTFFSYNGDGFSPARLSWEAIQQQLYAMAICDFDVLTGLNEILYAGDILKLRTTGGFETRTFFDEYSEVVINSPGEPGVFYFMGMGFAREPEPETEAGKFLSSMLAQSHARNRRLIARINQQLTAIACDYDNDVLPLTPAGNATERHIVLAYYNLALQYAGNDPGAATDYWAEQLGLNAEEVGKCAADTNKLLDLLRSKLMKKGGLGYEQPDDKSFPLLDDVIKMILGCGAIPVSTWLDGTYEGEADPETQLQCLLAKGVAAVNIIPDRNWNISDQAEREQKIKELNRYIKTAEALHLPIMVGTELNKPGQRFVDDFDASALKPHLHSFLYGANFIIGQTRLLRYANFSFVGDNARAEFPDRTERNDFFAAAGALPPPEIAVHEKLQALADEKAYARIQDSVRLGRWQQA